MLHIVNYSHKDVNLGNGTIIAANSTIDVDIEYTSIMVNLARAGIISVTDAQTCSYNKSSSNSTSSRSDDIAERIRIAKAKRASFSK